MEVRPLGDDQVSGRRPGPLPLLAAVVALLVAGALFARVDAPSGIPPPPTTTTIPELFTLREAFEGWPAFEVTWRVGRVPGTDSVPVAGLGVLGPDVPCRPEGDVTCYVRFAWRDTGAWSLAVSPDSTFQGTELAKVVRGRVAYRLEGGVVTEVAPGTTESPAGTCRGLLSASEGSSGPIARRVLPASGAFQGAALRFEQAGRAPVMCAEPWGIPLEFVLEGNRFEAVSVSVGEAAPEELGTGLVAGRVETLPTSGCGEGGRAFTATPAGRWMAERLADQGLPALPVGSAMAVRLGPGREAFVWVGRQELSLAPGFRTREVEGTFLEEVLSPAAAVSGRAAVGIRVWAMSVARTGPVLEATERVIADLGDLVADLVHASLRSPYRGPLPVGEPVFGPAGPFDLNPALLELPEGGIVDHQGPGFVLRMPETRMVVAPLQRLPREGFWTAGPSLADGSTVLFPVQEEGSGLILAGASVVNVELVEGRMPEIASAVANALNRCPWVGTPAQPSG